MTDIEIARKSKMLPIDKVAKSLGISSKHIINYGNYMAKIDEPIKKQKGKLILVTAMNPTKLGEGKTTVSIGLADAMNIVDKKRKTCLALREPSLGPVFGIKGGATGGGQSQILPMEDINLHFTGDFSAITDANNLLSAAISNHIYHGNQLNINPFSILFNRCLDVNDRALRSAILEDGHAVYNEQFNITAASEIMAILCVSEDLEDLKEKLGNIMVATTYDGEPVYCRDLKMQDAMAILLKHAIKPNLVQTIEHTPAIVHCGPFANIAHGCNSIIATKQALGLADYVVTEAGFGADLGAEKFLDFKCQKFNLVPNVVVIVATIRGLKVHGGANFNELKTNDMESIQLGMPNLEKHIENIKNVYKLPCVVAINRFSTDTNSEIELVRKLVEALGVDVVVTNSYTEGGKGAKDLAQKVIALAQTPNNFSTSYKFSMTVKEKIKAIATKIYGADDVEYSEQAEEKIKFIADNNLETLPVIIAKTQYSFSDDAKLLGRPTGFNLKIRDIDVRTGAGFIVPLAGNMLLMPGLPKEPVAVNMTISKDGEINGLS